MAAALPLSGLRVLEIAGLGSVTLAATMLADMGADVVRIERADVPEDESVRLRRRVILDLSQSDDRCKAMALIRSAEALIEGFRPGVMERFGLGPDMVHAENPRMTYLRVTGWGQSGPLATAPGHDINYIALSGVLGRVGGVDPVVPLNLISYGAGAAFAALGLVAGVIAARGGAPGQVIDLATAESALYLMTKQFAWFNAGFLTKRGSNLVDGGAWFYTTYRCADGHHVAVGAVEPKFRTALVALLDLNDTDLGDGDDRASWPAWRHAVSSRFATRRRDEWIAEVGAKEACVTPVLNLEEVPEHPHFRGRQAFAVGKHGALPAAVPGFRAVRLREDVPREDHLESILTEWDHESSRLRRKDQQ